MGAPGVKAILGYDILDGVSEADYETWLRDVHVPDLLANPYLDRLVFDDVVRPITSTSAGTPTTDEPATFYRITELHFADHDAYDAYLEWFREHPIPLERSPQAWTKFRFYVLCDAREVTRADTDD
ncbi:MAG: hypothetical protein R3290_06635 [Acidimicrobiia bacterium]|nr:hypothetical protein [Acidimicrobiia bacterium]